MFRNQKVNIILLAVLFMLLIGLVHYAPAPVDWRYSFSDDDKIPYGCWVLKKDVLPVVFPDNHLATNTVSFFESLPSLHSSGDNLLIVTLDFNPDSLDLKKLLEFVNRGNHVFISSYRFPEELENTLNVESVTSLTDSFSFIRKETVLNLANPALKKSTGYVFNQFLPSHYFQEMDTSNSVVLGYDNSHHLNFIKTRFGKGDIYLHCQPFVFTNYHLLYSNYEYASAVLSYLPDSYTLWDEYYKPFRKVIGSPVRYILTQKSLKQAYFLAIFTILLYLAFGGKRRQRIIPVMHPPKNTSLDFVRIIGRLYMQRKDHRDLVLKKINYFKEWIHSKYLISTDIADKSFYRNLSLRSGVQADLIREIFQSAESIRKSKHITTRELVAIHEKIQEFNKKCL